MAEKLNLSSVNTGGRRWNRGWRLRVSDAILQDPPGKSELKKHAVEKALGITGVSEKDDSDSVLSSQKSSDSVEPIPATTSKPHAATSEIKKFFQ